MNEPGLRPRVARLEEDVTAISDTLVDIQETLARHSSTLDEHTRLLDDHGRQLTDIRTTQLQQGEVLVEILRRLDAG